MKTSQDPRHVKRESLVKELFSWGFTNTSELKLTDTKEIIRALNRIDKKIKVGAPTWPINQINKVDLAILRLAVFELIIVKEAPFRVIADEAVEIAKKYGSESSSSFVNGVLGNIITSQKLDKGDKNNV